MTLKIQLRHKSNISKVNWDNCQTISTESKHGIEENFLKLKVSHNGLTFRRYAEYRGTVGDADWPSEHVNSGREH